MSQHSVSLNASRILNTTGVPPKQLWNGTYLASCVQNNDPLGEGRIKMYIPQVIGTAVSNWARPLGYTPPDIPVPGEMLHAFFAGGDVNHPVWVKISFASEFAAIQTQISSIGPGSWQSVTPSGGWSNSAGFIPMQARIITPGVAQVVGNIQGGSVADNTKIGTLPSGYYLPGQSQVIPAQAYTGASGTELAGVNGSTDTGHLNNGTISGVTDTEGLPNGGINGTSASASGSGSHTHGPGSYSVSNGQHFHYGSSGGGTLAVTDGSHQHTLNSVTVSIPLNYNSPLIKIDGSGNMTLLNFATGGATKITFNATVVV